MKKFILLFSLVFLAVISCKTENTNRPTGTYLEKSPVANRTAMNFTSESRVIITFADSTEKEFSYSVGEETMTLTPLNVATYPAKNVFFHYTDPNKFEIGNFYDGALQGEIIVFEKPKAK